MLLLSLTLSNKVDTSGTPCAPTSLSRPYVNMQSALNLYGLFAGNLSFRRLCGRVWRLLCMACAQPCSKHNKIISESVPHHGVQLSYFSHSSLYFLID